MRLLGTIKTFRTRIGSETGTTLIETLIALAILGAVAVTFLSGLATTSAATIIADKLSIARSLARGQIEWVKNADYVYEATQYSPAPIPDNEDYTNYSVVITAEPLNAPDDGIQKITITAKRAGEEVIKLEGYKVDR